MTELVAAAPGSGRSGAADLRAWQRGTLLAACLGLFMVFIQITQTISSLTALGEDLEVGPARLAWVPSMYTLAVATLVLSGGAIGDRLGRKPTYAAGVVVMLAGTVVVATAQDLAAVLVGQALVGVGAAAVLPNSLALLTAAFTDAQARAGAIAVWVAASGVGLALGPLVAGVLTELAGWRAVFLVNVPVGVVTLVVTAVVVRDSRLPGNRLDVPGQLLSVVGIGALVFAVIEGGRAGADEPAVVTAAVLAAVALAAFVVVERRVAHPMFDVRRLAVVPYATSLVVAAVGLFGFVGVSLLQVLFLGRVQGLDTLEVGLRLLAAMVTFVVVTAVAGRVVRRRGPRGSLVAGLALAGAGSLAFLAQGPDSSFAVALPALLLLGAGCGLVVAPSTVAAVSSLPPDLASRAAGAVNATRQLGAVLGTSVLGAVLTTRYLGSLPDELARRGVVGPPADAVVASARAGGVAVPDGIEADLVRAAVADAFTAGVHLGSAVAGAVLLATAVLAAVGLRSSR